MVDPDTWVHLAGVFDESAGKIRFYLDGELAAEAPFDAPWQADGPITLGGSQAHAGPADFWPGAIADARVYQSALTEEDIRQLRDETRPATRAPRLTVDPAHSVPDVMRGTWD